MIVCWNAWPMCSVPVTFGGGSRMQYGWPRPLGAKLPACSQHAYHFDSICLGSKLLSMRNSKAAPMRRRSWQTDGGLYGRVTMCPSAVDARHSGAGRNSVTWSPGCDVSPLDPGPRRGGEDEVFSVFAAGQGMHRLHQHPHGFRIDLRRDAVAEVEHVGGMWAEVVKHAVGFTRDHVRRR